MQAKVDLSSSRTFRPHFGNTVLYLLGYAFVFIIISLASRDHRVSWSVIGLIVLAMIWVVFVSSRWVYKIKIDLVEHNITVYHIRFFMRKIDNFSIKSTEASFIVVPGARGIKKEIFRFKSIDKKWDLEFGISGWSKSKIIEVQDLIQDLRSSQNI